MKRVYSTSAEVCHIWAQQGGHDVKCRNVFTEGDRIYSYGYHFELARFVRKGKRQCVLLNCEGSTPTTSKHKREVRAAVGHLPHFSIPRHCFEDNKKTIANYKARIDAAYGEARKARLLKKDHLSRAHFLHSEFNSYCEFFGLKTRGLYPADHDKLVRDAEECETIRDREELARSERYEADKARREADALIPFATKLQEWRDGKRPIHLPMYHPYSYEIIARQYMRIVGDEVQTSLGAVVPTDHFMRAYRVLKRLRDNGQTYLRNGHTEHVGHYTIESMDAAGIVKVGCHTFEWAEVELTAATIQQQLTA